MNKFRLIVLITIVLSSFSLPGVALEDCLEELKGIFSRFASIKAPLDDKVYFFEYVVTTVSRDKNTPSSNMKVEMLTTKNYSEVRSEQMVSYQDDKNSFVVIPFKNLIYWGDSQLGLADSAVTSGLGGLQLKVLNMCMVKECKEVSGSEGKFNKEIVLNPNDEIKKRFGFNELKFLVNSRTSKLYKTQISYVPQSKLASLGIVYETIDFDYKKASINYPVTTKFLTADGKLLPKYKGYKLIDVRKK